jgi:hypothetical protein
MFIVLFKSKQNKIKEGHSWGNYNVLRTKLFDSFNHIHIEFFKSNVWFKEKIETLI